ncbi:MAG: nuclear transport factor 2 family protein [Stappiaceae bacterium]
MTSSLKEVISAYGAAWSEPDADKRLALLTIAWSEDGLYQDPSGEAVGRQALSDRIGGFHAQQPGARVELTSGFSEHHGKIYFSWRMLTPDGNVAINGVDFGTLDDEGRLTQIVGFFGPPPVIDPV